MAEMTSASINDLPDSAFAYIEPGGSKDAQGKTVPRSLRHFPVHDAPHVRNALAQMSKSPMGAKAKDKIMAAAKRFGVHSEGVDSTQRSDDLMPWPDRITRAYPVEDLEVRSGKVSCERCGRDASGRMVDAYAAVFDVPTEVRDGQGHYLETIDRSAFNRAISHGSRSGFKNISVFYNHGKTLYDTPSEMGSFPLGHPAVIRADGSGLLTSTHYGNNDVSERVLQQILDGDISGHSFTGRTLQSDPAKMPRSSRGGELLRVRRLELSLQEYGPTPVPYYEDTRVLAVRSALLADQHFGDDSKLADNQPQAGDSPLSGGTQGGQAELSARIDAALKERGQRQCQ